MYNQPYVNLKKIRDLWQMSQEQETHSLQRQLSNHCTVNTFVFKIMRDADAEFRRTQLLCLQPSPKHHT